MRGETRGPSTLAHSSGTCLEGTARKGAGAARTLCTEANEAAALRGCSVRTLGAARFRETLDRPPAATCPPTLPLPGPLAQVRRWRTARGQHACAPSAGLESARGTAAPCGRHAGARAPCPRRKWPPCTRVPRAAAPRACAARAAPRTPRRPPARLPARPPRRPFLLPRPRLPTRRGLTPSDLAAEPPSRRAAQNPASERGCPS